MIYLNKDDLVTVAFERLIDESSADFQDTIINCELQNIELIKGYLSSRYNTDEIFNVLTPIRNTIIVRILSKLTIFDIVRRNAGRKVPTDYKEEYDKAIELLEKISTGRIKLTGVPPAVDENGNINSNSIWGNNSNKNFYI